jgi:hypothetical protein
MVEVKVGDRVRIVFEDEVEEVGISGFITVVAGGRYISGSGNYAEAQSWAAGKYGVVSIEVIPPPFVLPTKRWAQVVDDLGILWTRKSLDGFGPYEWYNLAGVGNISRDLLARKGLRVISEGVDDE